METKTPRHRFLRLFSFVVIMLGQIYMLYCFNWSVVHMYSIYTKPFWLTGIIYLHLLWGIHNLIEYINFENPKDNER